MGIAASQSQSMNISPTPTGFLINQKSLWKSQSLTDSPLVSVDAFSQSSDDTDDQDSDSGLRARGPPSKNSHSSGNSSEDTVSVGKADDKLQFECSLTSCTGNKLKRSQKQDSVRTQKLRNVHNTPESRTERMDSEQAPVLYSQKHTGSVFSWVSEDLLRPNMHPASSGSTELNDQTRQKTLPPDDISGSQYGDIVDPSCDRVVDDVKYCYYNINASGNYETGEFCVEQCASSSVCGVEQCASSSVRGPSTRHFESGHFTGQCSHESKCISDMYSMGRNHLPGIESLDGAHRTVLESNSREESFHCIRTAAVALNKSPERIHQPLYDDETYSFGALQGSADITVNCLNSMHAGETGSFSAYAETESQHDSQTLNLPTYSPDSCQTQALHDDLMLDSMRSDASIQSSSGSDTCETCPSTFVQLFTDQASTTTKANVDDRIGHHHSLTPASKCLTKEFITSIGFATDHVDHGQLSFGGGGHPINYVSENGFTSIGFGPDAGCALPETFDSFQSVPYMSVSSRLEALSGRYCVVQQSNDGLVDSGKNHSATSQQQHLSKMNHDSDSSFQTIPHYIEKTSTSNCQNNHRQLVHTERKHLQQASQGGAGKLLDIHQEIDEEGREKVPTCNRNSSVGKSNHDNQSSLVALPNKCVAKPGHTGQIPLDTNHNFVDTQTHRVVQPFIKFSEPANDALSIFDGPSGYKQYYAAFLCCAPEDLEHFGISFHAKLESWGFRIFLPPRDLVLTGCNFDNMSRALEERCNGKIIVILSVNYEASEECSFLTSFARVLDPDARKRNIIPVQIDKQVEIKNVLKGLSIIRYNHDYKCGWLKQKLVDAIAA